jgi:hypothetical protein
MIIHSSTSSSKKKEGGIFGFSGGGDSYSGAGLMF